MRNSDRQIISEVPEIAKIVPGNGGLTRVLIRAPAAEGEMHLHGGHFTSWKPRGWDEVLYLSPRSEFRAGRAIRGGVPVCFPWFGDKAGDPKASAHGVVRNQAWELESGTAVRFRYGAARRSPARREAA